MSNVFFLDLSSFLIEMVRLVKKYKVRQFLAKEGCLNAQKTFNI